VIEAVFLDGLDCLPCNLTLNFIGEAVRLSKLSSLGMGGLTVPRMGKTRGHSRANALRLLSPSSWVALCETKRNKGRVFICVSCICARRLLSGRKCILLRLT